MDFFQNELFVTLHDFGIGKEGKESSLLGRLPNDKQTAVLIPALYSEFQRPAMTHIIEELAHCPYIQYVFVAFHGEKTEQYIDAYRHVAKLPQTVLPMWCNGPRVMKLFKLLREQKNGVDILQFPDGKGLSVWKALGIATLLVDYICLLDADIVTFDRTYPAKLLFPLLENYGISYSKAYYARLHQGNFMGRVVRLWVLPLLSALQEMHAGSPLLSFLRGFRYPLSGEFAITSDMVMNIQIPAHWGLEIGMLAEVYRNVVPQRVSQVDLGFFDHKHQKVGKSDEQGLRKMCRDILLVLLAALQREEHIIVTSDYLATLEELYEATAKRLVHFYGIDASFNGFPYERAAEEALVDQFLEVLENFHKDFDSGSIKVLRKSLPNWSRINAIDINFRKQLLEAVYADIEGAKQALSD
jgi:glucosyl-3-phosphoglycerate synthase